MIAVNRDRLIAPSLEFTDQLNLVKQVSLELIPRRLRQFDHTDRLDLASTANKIPARTAGIEDNPLCKSCIQGLTPLLKPATPHHFETR